jgi:flagellar basal-body rod protein FlgB
MRPPAGAGDGGQYRQARPRVERDQRRRAPAYPRLSSTGLGEDRRHGRWLEPPPMSSRLTESIDFHGQALLLRAERQKVIAGNIANADTPAFAARDFDFRAALAEATGARDLAPGGGAAPTAPAVVQATTHAGHLAAGGGTGGPGRIDSTVLKYRATEQPSIDGNSVDLDRERASFADNAVRYEAGLRFINGSVRTMLSAIRGE